MRVRRTAASFVVALLLGGCAASSTTARALPRLTPSVAPVVRQVDDATPAGAVAFARHFFAQISVAFATADPSLVSSLSAPGCRTCQRFITSLTELRDKHERTTPVTFTLRFAEAPATIGRTARVDIQYDVPASTRYDASGRVVYREAATVRDNATVELVRVGKAWLVAEIR